MGYIGPGNPPDRILRNCMLPIVCSKLLFAPNTQKLLGFKDKTLLPTYDVFDETRYFTEGKEQKIWTLNNKKIGILICEDVWNNTPELTPSLYARDPVEEMKLLKPDVLLIPSASPYYFKKMDLRTQLYAKVAKTFHCPVIVCNQVGGNDQLIFDGYSLCYNRSGEVIYVAKSFEESCFEINLEELPKKIDLHIDHTKDLYDALVMGVKDYFKKLDLHKACIGLSGGIDSSLAACIAVDALGRDHVLGLSMPSRFSSVSSMEDANTLVQNLQIAIKHIPIDHIFQQFLDLLSPHFLGKKFDATEENLQARIRGIILMAISNKLGFLVLSTGNKSEMAMGYATLYGDMAGGLGLLNDVSKTQIYELASYVNRNKEIIPKSCFTKPPSAELKANQKDEDDLPPYAIVDRVLVDYVEEHLPLEKIVEKNHFSTTVVMDLIHRIHKAEFKRRQGPIALRVSKRSFSKGRVFPIVQGWVKYRKI